MTTHQEIVENIYGVKNSVCASFLKLARCFFNPEGQMMMLSFVSSGNIFPIEHVTVSFEWHGAFLENIFLWKTNKIWNTLRA